MAAKKSKLVQRAQELEEAVTRLFTGTPARQEGEKEAQGQEGQGREGCQGGREEGRQEGQESGQEGQESRQKVAQALNALGRGGVAVPAPSCRRDVIPV